MKIGILSDIHDNIWNLRAALEGLGEADALICCGDLCSPFVVGLLGEGFPGRPIHVVFGNNDGDLFRITQNASRVAGLELHGELFQGELVAALKILQRGDLPLSDLKGAYAGEIGQTQFLPSSYIKYGVDFDGNGRRDLMHNAPDVLASTANYLVGHGWQRGKDWAPGNPNFAALQQWNKSDVYARTIAYFATQLAHAP